MALLPSIQKYDILTFDWFVHIRHRALAIRLSRIVSFTADGPLYVFIGLVFLYFQHWQMAKLLAAGFVIERIAYKLFKTTFRRNRPPDAIPGYQSAVDPPDQFSFPSGHASGAFLMVGSLAYFFPWLAWALYSWACCVGIARIILGVHFPSDIIAGALLGSSTCILLTTLLF